MKNEEELKQAQKLLEYILQELEQNPRIIPNKINGRTLSEYGIVLTHLVYLLTNVNLNPEEAKKLLEETFHVRIKMSECLMREVDFRVALLDLIIQKKDLIKDPKLIEIKLYLEQEKKAVIDYLTGLYNKAYFEEAMDREINQAKRYNREFSLILIDIDNFKQINDTYGHLMGDEVLKTLAKIIQLNVRKEDTMCRLGGEEFAIILPDTSIQGANKVAEKIRQLFNNETLSDVNLSFSAGISVFPKNGTTKLELIEAADRALYFSKYSGKNKVTNAINKDTN